MELRQSGNKIQHLCSLKNNRICPQLACFVFRNMLRWLVYRSADFQGTRYWKCGAVFTNITFLIANKAIPRDVVNPIQQSNNLDSHASPRCAGAAGPPTEGPGEPRKVIEFLVGWREKDLDYCRDGWVVWQKKNTAVQHSKIIECVHIYLYIYIYIHIGF